MTSQRLELGPASGISASSVLPAGLSGLPQLRRAGSGDSGHVSRRGGPCSAKHDSLSVRIRITVFQIDSRQPDFRAWAGSLRLCKMWAPHVPKDLKILGQHLESLENTLAGAPSKGCPISPAPGSSRGFGVSGHLSLTFNS